MKFDQNKAKQAAIYSGVAYATPTILSKIPQAADLMGNFPELMGIQLGAVTVGALALYLWSTYM